MRTLTKNNNNKINFVKWNEMKSEVFDWLETDRPLYVYNLLSTSIFISFLNSGNKAIYILLHKILQFTICLIQFNYYTTWINQSFLFRVERLKNISSIKLFFIECLKLFVFCACFCFLFWWKFNSWYVFEIIFQTRLEW